MELLLEKLENDKHLDLLDLSLGECSMVNGGSELSDAVAYGLGRLFGAFVSLGQSNTSGVQRAGGNFF